MKLSDLQVGDAVVYDHGVRTSVNGILIPNVLELSEVTQVFSKMIEVNVASSPTFLRFSKVSGKEMRLQLNDTWDSQHWALSGSSTIAVPTAEQMKTLEGYKGNSQATAIRTANEATIASIVEQVKKYLDQDSPTFGEHLQAIKQLLDVEPSEIESELPIDAIARLEQENRQLRDKVERAISALS